MRSGCLVRIALSIVPAAPALAGGQIISDRSYFGRIPHTLIDFESFPDGTPIELPEGQGRALGGDEYNSLGVLIFGAPIVVNFTSDDLETIQEEHASPKNSLALLGSAPTDPAGFSLAGGVRGWGIFITLDVSTPTSRPTFHIGRSGEVFQTIVFEGELVQGRVGDIEYGFVGWADDDPFTAVVFENFFRPAFDDLHLSVIPAPGAGAAFGLFALGALARRRR